DPETDLRVWVPGCSSGEEAYSIAMLFAEATRRFDRPFNVQIFATDIDEQMLQIARQGVYSLSAIADIPQPLRDRYTNPHGERFEMAPAIRDAVRFSSHSLVKDPPFSRIDLVSCRNLLIYFGDKLQQSVLPILHYALRPEGFLFLGPSESVGRFEALFGAVDANARLFQRSAGAPAYPLQLPGGRTSNDPRRSDTGRSPYSTANEPSAAVQRIMDRYAPPTLVVDADAGILSAYGRLGRYFDFPVTRNGGASAISLARPGLRTVLGPLIRQTREAKRRTIARDVEVVTEYGVQPLDVICDPLSDGSTLVVLRENGEFRHEGDQDLLALEDGDDHLEALEDELRRTRHRLRTAVEELETANEELKSSNEEMMSMNEELQSTNEELTTVNDELKVKVDQLFSANSDLRNFFESTDLAVVVVDQNARVRRFTAAATGLFPLQQADLGRPLADVQSRLETLDYLHDIQKVLSGETTQARRLSTRDGLKTYSLRTLPYRSQEGVVEGVTLVLADITEALALERELAAEKGRLDLAVRAAGIGVWSYDPQEGVSALDETERNLLDAPSPHEPLTAFLERVHPDDRLNLQKDIDHALAQSGAFDTLFRLGTADACRWIKGHGRVCPPSAPMAQI
ncbi:hypothetical protein LTR94_025681, partial [Friedmanniomyces endolithicus]